MIQKYFLGSDGMNYLLQISKRKTWFIFRGYEWNEIIGEPCIRLRPIEYKKGA